MNKHIGSRLDEFLEEEDLLAETEAVAIKRVIAWQIERLMKEEGLTKSEMARRMGTSRSALERLLDPSNPSVTLLTIERAAKALGKKVRVELAA
ncbi:MAG: helix-turn-helix transcriptional regulator [Wenzhouxiangellaceae bacterium]